MIQSIISILISSDEFFESKKSVRINWYGTITSFSDPYLSDKRMLHKQNSQCLLSGYKTGIHCFFPSDSFKFWWKSLIGFHAKISF